MVAFKNTIRFIFDDNDKIPDSNNLVFRFSSQIDDNETLPPSSCIDWSTSPYFKCSCSSGGVHEASCTIWKDHVHGTGIFVYPCTTDPVIPPIKFPCIDKENGNDFDCECDPESTDNDFTVECGDDTPVEGDDCDKWTDTDDGVVEHPCPCDPFVEDSEDFDIECGNGEVTPPSVSLGPFYSYVGITSGAKFSPEFVNVKSYFGYWIPDLDIQVANMRFDGTSYIGIDSTAAITRQIQFSTDSYFGVSVNTFILYDQYTLFGRDTTSYFGFDSTAKILYNPYTLFFKDGGSATASIGSSVNTIISYDVYNPISKDPLNVYVGFDSTSKILYNPYNLFDVIGSSYFGVSSSSIIYYDIPNYVFTSDINTYTGWYTNTNVFFDINNPVTTGPINYYFGYDSTSTIFIDIPVDISPDPLNVYVGYEVSTNILYNPYNLFFKNGDSLTLGFGYHTPINVLVNPYNLFFKNGDVTTSVFGYHTPGNILYNPYNPMPLFNPIEYGYGANAEIRYNDDHRVTPDDIILSVGYEVNADVKFGDYHVKFTPTTYVGFDSNAVTQLTIGFIAKSYIGFRLFTKYITFKQKFIDMGTAIAGFGYYLHNNHMSPYYIDLSKSECCAYDRNDIIHIEMTNEDDVDVRYGVELDYGLLSSIAEVTTAPRFFARSYFGVTSDSKDNSVYLGPFEIGFGMSCNVRGISGPLYIDMGNGNFITNQDEIKVEMTKPDDQYDRAYAFNYGYGSTVRLGTSAGLNPYPYNFGISSYVSVYVLEALRASFYFGNYVTARINLEVKLYPYSFFGFESVAYIYEAPYYMYTGFTMNVDAIITENFVELLEEGELDNNYLFQTPAGDIDESRPNGESIEGYPFTRYVNGRCT